MQVGKTTSEVSHVLEGENRQTLNKDSFRFSVQTRHCFSARPCVSLPDGSSHPEPRPVASLGSLLDDQHWHHLSLVLSGSQMNFTVDKHAEVVLVPAELNIQQVGGAHGCDRTIPADLTC